MGALTTHGQSYAVAQALIAAYFHLPLDVLGYFSSQVSFYLQVLIDIAAQPHYLFIGQAAHLGIRIYLAVSQDNLAGGTADPEDVGEGNLHALIPWKINARYSRQDKIPPVNLTLPLLMAGILADN
jgi:hypothetical protein